MKIGIVLHPYNMKNQTGLGRYAFEVTENILKNDKENEYIIFLKNKPEKLTIFENDNWSIKIIDKKYFWLDRGLRKQKLDVCLFFTPFMPFFVNFKKTIVVVHDLSYRYIKPEKLKEKIKNYIIFLIHKYSVNKANKVVAVSETTKKDIVNLFKIKEEKIKVIYNGVNELPLEKEIHTPQNFFLFVGSIKPRKNILNLVKAFVEFKKEDKQGFKLVLSGNKGGKYYEKLLSIIKENNLNKEVIFLGYVDDAQLSFIYKRAYALVYPSVIEGFGMTVLEAISQGTPVLISNIIVFKEVFKEVAIFFNEKDYVDISQKMIEISLNKDLRNDLSIKGLNFSKSFTWEKTALGFIKLLKSDKNNSN